MKKKKNLNIEIDGIGCDIIEIKRLKEAYNRRKEPFLNKLFSENEKKYCLKFKDPFSHFAARFAAKEAVVKSFGTGFGKEISFLEIEILNELNGKPYVKLSDELNKKLGFPKISITMSHCNAYATAFCISKN
ncbi:MAG: holo-ACP synthase [Parachlamydiales bacterium]|jgi:holo-[acyl-carrier protein] synthase